MRWLIWPRQYGKTHRILQWWMEDPENRVILCQSEEIARHHRRKIEEAVLADSMGPVMRRRLRENIMSHRSWHSANIERRPQEIALDGDRLVIQALEKVFCQGGHSLQVIAECGRNEEPEPHIKEQVDAFHAKWKHLDPPGTDSSVN